MSKLSIVIINFNTSEFLKKCLENLIQNSEHDEIVVVDNASKDGSVEMLEQQFSEIHVVKNQKNLGLASASNQGLSKTTGDIILYMGTDAFPEKGTITGIKEYLEQNSNVGAATSKLVLRNGELDMDAHRGFPTPWTAITHFSRINRLFWKSKLFNRYFMGYKNMDVPHEIDMCISHFLMIKKEVFDQIGIWDEDYFLYGEDVDMCYRINEAGWKIMYLPQFTTKHLKGVSVGVRKETSDITTADQETKTRSRKNSTEAMRMFYQKHYTDKYPWVLRSMVLTGISVLEFIRSKK